MHAILIYTVPSKPDQNFVPVDSDKDLAQAIDNILKKGIDATITVYLTAQKSYHLTYKDKSRTVIDKIPEVSLT